MAAKGGAWRSFATGSSALPFVNQSPGKLRPCGVPAPLGTHELLFMIVNDFFGLLESLSTLQARNLEQLLAKSWPFSETNKELHQSLKTKLVHWIVWHMIPNSFEDHAQPNLQWEVRNQFVRYYATKKNSGCGKSLQGIVDIVVVLIEQAVDHAGERILVQDISRMLVAIQDLHDGADLHLVSVHLLVVLLHLAIGGLGRALPSRPFASMTSS